MIYVKENEDIIRKARAIVQEEMRQPMQHFVECGLLVTFIDYKYRVRRILYFGYANRKNEKKVARFISKDLLKLMKSEQLFNFYTDEVEFNYMLTKDWILNVK